MPNIRIAADSTCDLSDELIERYQITIIPLNIVLDDKSYLDGVEITPDEIYTWSDKYKKTPKTSAITPETAIEKIKGFVDNGDDIIFFGISSEMSTTCNVMKLVREELSTKRLFVIDSKNLSTGIGLQVLRAAQMVTEGKKAEDIVKEIEAAREQVSASFVVDTLTYLARGGRCTQVTALLANTLHLKPRIEVHNGEMGVGKKYRGNIEKVIHHYVKDLTEELLQADSTRVFITHSGCSDEVIQKVYEEVKQLNYFKEILITRAGGVISSHCGPNTLGVLYYKQIMK